MSAFVTGDPDQDFFKQNPELKYISEFKALIDTRGKEEASKIMWSLYMIEDPKSKIFRMPRKDKLLEVKTNYWPEFDEEQFTALGKTYGKYCMEKEEFLYNIQIEKLDQLTEILRTLTISDDDSDLSKYIRIMDKLPKIWDGLDKVRKNMIDKMNKSVLRGGAQRSSREKRT